MLTTVALVNTISTAAIVNPSSGGGSSDTSVKTQIQLNGSGVGFITLANANTYEVLSAVYDTAASDQSQVERVSKSDTSKINLQSQSATNAGANKYVNVEYILASDLS